MGIRRLTSFIRNDTENFNSFHRLINLRNHTHVVLDAYSIVSDLYQSHFDLHYGWDLFRVRSQSME